MSDTPVAGFLLAGGQSSRMGSDKALLTFQGELLVERALRTLRKVCEPVIIAGGVARLATYAPVIPDLNPGNGPLGGIVAALERTTSEWNLFLAVDMPLLPVAALRGLVASFDRSSLITLAQANGRVQPLCGVYSRQSLPVLRAEFAKGNLRVRAAVEATQSFSYWQAQDLEWFANVNTPEEFAAAEALANSADHK